MQGTMKAARIYGFEKTSKSTDLLRVDDVPIPDIESGEVLIRVLWAEYCRVPATNVVRLRPDDDINEMCKVSQMTVGYRALKRARLHSGETVIVNGATGITGIGTVLSALAMGAARVIAIARNPARLEKLVVIDPKRVATVALGKGESITQKVKALTDGQGASVVADLSPGG